MQEDILGTEFTITSPTNGIFDAGDVIHDARNPDNIKPVVVGKKGMDPSDPKDVAKLLTGTSGNPFKFLSG